jgi:hypothetical protein
VVERRVNEHLLPAVGTPKRPPAAFERFAQGANIEVVQIEPSSPRMSLLQKRPSCWSFPLSPTARSVSEGEPLAQCIGSASGFLEESDASAT